jgi:hypothetical protein
MPASPTACSPACAPAGRLAAATAGNGCCGNGTTTYGGVGGVITSPATGVPAETIPAQPKPGEAPKKMPSTTPMTFGGAIHDVTPVVAPRLGVEQEGPKQPF